jgi:nucleolar protein 56
MVRRRPLLATLGTAVLAGCGAASTDAELRAPDATLVDGRFAVELAGAPSLTTVRMTARAEDGRSYTPTWSASATFRSTEDGTVSPAEQSPRSGSYDGVDPMGLLWSMDTDEPAAEAFFPPGDHDVTLTASVDGETVARTTVGRRLAVDGVESRPLDPVDLVGTIHTPPGDGPAPGVLLLHGAGGREPTAAARLLSARGFVACSLRYFGGDPSLPDVLAEVPVEYARRAVDRLLAHPRVAGPQVGVRGVSKGAELALLLGSHDGRVGAVVGVSPSTVVWEGFDGEGRPAGTSSWTVDGEPVPYVPLAAFGDVPGDPVRNPRALYEYSELRADPERVAAATVPVERVRGAVALFSGTDDRRWHSTAMADRAVDRLAEADHTHEHTHRRFEGAGHAMPLPYLPTYGASASPSSPLGGAPAPNARASEGHWFAGLETLAGVDEAFEPGTPPVEDDAPEPAVTPERGVLAGALVAGALGAGALFRRTRDGDDDGSLTGFLRSTSGRVTFLCLSLVAGAGLVLLGRPGYATIAAVFAFLFLNDALSTRAWDWLHVRIEERSDDAAEPGRELTPHGVSTTTKVVVLLGTLLFAWLLLVSAVLGHVAG